MRLRDSIVSFVCVILAAAMLIGASTRLESIHKSREELKLVSVPDLENAPPEVAFATVALGAFRGVVVDILWMRAEKLKEEGQFFDARQIAEWITILQPRFAAVWDFQAWNMAYNISVAMPNENWEDRWMWVRNGYELLRDQGIEKNPHSILLYRSLAWIFQHKIGGVTDNCHKDYKRELALSMRRLLKPSGEYTDLTNEDFKKLRAAPMKVSELLKDPEVAKLVAAIRKVDDQFKDDDDLADTYLDMRANPKKYDQKIFDAIDLSSGTGAIDKLDDFCRAYVLRNEWKFDIELMDKLNVKYGPSAINDPNDTMPLNWEHPDVHAMYWGELGLIKASKKGEYSIDEKNTDRIVFHALQKLYRMGKIIIQPLPNEPATVYLLPDLRMFDPCNRAWIDAIEKYLALQKSNPKGVFNGHRNFLENAVFSFYQAGHKAKAGEIYTSLRDRYNRPEHKVRLLTFVQGRLREELASIEIHDATEQLMMTLRESYFLYANNQDDEALGRESFAKEVYKLYVDRFGDEEHRRIDLPSFENLSLWSLSGFLDDKMYPKVLRDGLRNRIRVERPELMDKLLQLEAKLKEIDDKAEAKP